MRIKFVCDDRVGIAVDALQLIRKHDLNLQGIEVDPAGFMYIALPQIAFELVQQLMSEMRKIEGVHDVSIVDSMPSESKRLELQMLIEHIGIAVLRLDAKGLILHRNRAAQQMFGLPDKAIGAPVGQWLQSVALPKGEHVYREQLTPDRVVSYRPLQVDGVLIGWWLSITDSGAMTIDDSVTELLKDWLQQELPDAEQQFERYYFEQLMPLFGSTRALARRVGLSHTAVANKLKKLSLSFDSDTAKL